jgi:hypothetical protein
MFWNSGLAEIGSDCDRQKVIRDSSEVESLLRSRDCDIEQSAFFVVQDRREVASDLHAVPLATFGFVSSRDCDVGAVLVLCLRV